MSIVLYFFQSEQISPTFVTIFLHPTEKIVGYGKRGTDYSVPVITRTNLPHDEI